MSSITYEQGKDMLKTGRLSDFKITCNGFAFPVHKLLIANKSKFFQVCVDGKFQETEDGSVDLPEEEPLVVALALLYIYCGDSSNCSLHCNEEELRNTVHELWPALDITVSDDEMELSRPIIGKLAKLCKLADNLMMDDLLEAAESTLIDIGDPLSKGWTTYEGDLDVRKSDHDLLDFLTVVYETLPDNRNLRTRAVRMGIDFCRWKLDCSDVQDSIQALIKKHDEFA